MKQKVNPPKQINALIEKLERTINLGYSQIRNIEVIKPEINLKKAVLLQLVGKAHNLTEGILAVAKKGLPEVGDILLRSLLDTVITTQYIIIGKGDTHTMEFLLRSERDVVDMISKTLKFYSNHPEFQGTLGTKEELQNRKNDLENLIAKEEKKCGTSKMPNLRDMAIVADKEYKIADNEFAYITAYWYLSNQAHTNAKGLDVFMKTDGGDTFFQIDPHPDGLERLLKSTLQMYNAFIITLDQEINSI